MRLLTTAAVAILASAPIKAAYSQQTSVTSEAAAACAGLLTPAEINQTQSIAMHYAYSQLTSEGKNTNQGSGGNYYLISGSENYSTESHRTENVGLKWDLATSSSYLARFIPANQSTDYLSCVQGVEGATDGGVAIQFEDNINGVVTFKLKIRGLSGISLARHLSIWTNGQPTAQWEKSFNSGPTSIQVGVKWPDPTQPLVLRARMSQSGRKNGIIGKDANYILMPAVIERKEHHISGDVEARHPNKGPAGTYYSSPVFLRAAADEVFLGSSLKLPSGTWLHKTWGKKDIPCSATGFEVDKSSDGSIVSGRAFCTLGFYADENPGYLAHFEVDGVHVTVPKPDKSIKMVEREF